MSEWSRWRELLERVFGASAEPRQAHQGAMERTGRDDTVLKVLLQEYEHHKDELAVQIQADYRQAQFLQIYTALVIGALALMIRLPVPADAALVQAPEAASSVAQWTTPKSLIMVFLGWAATVAFFLASATLAPSYMFVVLRERLRELERAINQHVGNPQLMRYELEIVPHFLERGTYGSGIPTPHVLFGVWRALVFLFPLLGLCIGSVLFTPDWFALPYVGIVMALALWHVTLARSLYSGAGRQSIRHFFEDHGVENESDGTLRALADLAVLASAITVILWIALRGGEPWNLLDLPSRPTLFALAIMTAYAAISTAVPVLFAEANLILYPQYGLAFILVAAALGRAITFSLFHATRTSAFRLIRAYLAPTNPLRFRFDAWLRRWGWWGYVLVQSIPFMPMRMSAIAYSLAGASWLQLIGGALIGTVCRHLVLLALGLLTIEAVRAFLS